jgi:hypothetical protein
MMAGANKVEDGQTTSPSSHRDPFVVDPTDVDVAHARVALDPAAVASETARLFVRGSLGEQSIIELYSRLFDLTASAAEGDMGDLRGMLAAQSYCLNSMFTEFARRAALNLGGDGRVIETYARLALKAQAQCRANIEALDRIANGHEQTVKHVHVNSGGNAIVADEFHHHSGGDQNEKSGEQSHAKAAARPTASKTLPSSHPLGEGVPGSLGEGEGPLPDARGHKPRRARGQF